MVSCLHQGNTYSKRKLPVWREQICIQQVGAIPPLTRAGGFFFWTRFENLVSKRWKINDKVVPILVAIRNWNDVIWLSRTEKVADFAQCGAP